MELSPEVLSIMMFGGLLVGLFMGHPLAFVLGGLAIIFGWLGWGTSAFFMFANNIYGVMNSYVLVSIPLFVLMAQFLDVSGIAEELFGTLRIVLGPIKGGLAIAVVVVSTLFGACTGIIGASVVSMGLVSLPVMLKHGYDKKLSCGVICGGGSLGILIPPSIMLIVMGEISGVSVGKLFAGAIIPGLILSSLYISYILIKCSINPNLAPGLTEEEKAAINAKEILKLMCKSLLPTLTLILGVLGSIFTGFATPTEAAGVGAILSLILMIAYKQFTWNKLYRAVIQATKITSMVILILAGAACFTSVFMAIGGGDIVKDFILGIGLGKWGTYIVMMLIFFVLGLFIDWAAIVMITFPIFIPIAEQLGFDKLWFIVSIAVMLQDSFLTPPFGYALFYLKGVAPPEIKTSDIYWGAFPFWRLMELGLIIICVFPQTVLWLPSVLMK
ncbi:MAG: TRAP transporter large permease subunit [Desulfobacteraceae bacterium]|nr:TRAP transporter large permease subunit [Desulfobacteraceae bacterium]MBC2749965.1 TRAP transporter large permease subunit [Desulfobacteraceae bacterium]